MLKLVSELVVVPRIIVKEYLMKHKEQNGEVGSYQAVLASQDDNVLMRDINETNIF